MINLSPSLQVLCVYTIRKTKYNNIPSKNIIQQDKLRMNKSIKLKPNNITVISGKKEK